jgi:hypothetical protein
MLIVLILCFIIYMIRSISRKAENIDKLSNNICYGSYLWDYQTNKRVTRDKVLANTEQEDGKLRYRCKCNHFPFLPYKCVEDYCNDENIYGTSILENEKCHCSRRTYRQSLDSMPCTMCPWMVISDTVMKGFVKCQTKNSTGADLTLPLCPPHLYNSHLQRACIPFDIFYSK